MTVQLNPLPQRFTDGADECPWCGWNQEGLLDGPGPHNCVNCYKAFMFNITKDGEPFVEGVRSDTDLRYMDVMGLKEPKPGTLL